MSYEGYTEYLCLNGHYSTFDVYAVAPEQCAHCGERFTYRHSVDETNGETDHVDTRPAEKVECGWDDDWHVDHYANRYAIKLMKYMPASTAWVRIPAPEPVAEPPKSMYEIQFVDEDCLRYNLTWYMTTISIPKSQYDRFCRENSDLGGQRWGQRFYNDLKLERLSDPDRNISAKRWAERLYQEPDDAKARAMVLAVLDYDN